MLLAIFALLFQRRLEACTFGHLERFDPLNAKASRGAVPVLDRVRVGVHRPNDPYQSCLDTSAVHIVLDSREGVAYFGAYLRIKDGKLPFDFPEYPVWVHGKHMSETFHENPYAERPAFSATVEIRLVNAFGILGPPVQVTIQSPALPAVPRVPVWMTRYVQEMRHTFWNWLILFNVIDPLPGL